MSDTRKFYYLKLKEDFFNSPEMKLLESNNHGYEYEIIFLKLCLLSLSRRGELMFKDGIPYNVKSLSIVTGHREEVIKEAVNYFKSVQALEVFESGKMYMIDIELLIGHSSTEAERKATYRAKIEIERKSLTCDKWDNVPDIVRTNSTKDKDRDKEINQTDMTLSRNQTLIIADNPEFYRLQQELTNSGWSGNLRTLISNIGNLNVCLVYWDNHLKKEIENANGFFKGGWITEKFKSEAKDFFDRYERKKREPYEVLERRRSNYIANNCDFIKDYQKFIEHPENTDEDKEILRKHDYKSISLIPLKLNSTLEYFLRWKGY